MKDSVWVEKYRPQSIAEIISPHTEKILNYIKHPDKMPNLFFYNSIPGNGKTTFAKAIIKDMNLENDYIYLNGSDERGIDVIRHKIKKFVETKSFGENVRKCVYFDEADKLTKDSQDALRALTEEYSSNCFFLFTGNYLEKITDALLSRFIKIHLSNPDKKEIEKRLFYICKQERLNGSKEGVAALIDAHYPNIRNMIATLQDLKMSDKTIHPENIKKDDEVYSVIYNHIKKRRFEDIKKLVIEQGLDVIDLNKKIFEFIMSDKIEFEKMKCLLECVAENEFRFSMGCNPVIIFLNGALQMIDILSGGNYGG